MSSKNKKLEEIKKIPKSKLCKIIDDVRDDLKTNDVVKEMFKEYGVDLLELNYVPIVFADIDVSAKTDHGIIYLNYAFLLDGLEFHDHYIVHELTHWLQQTTGTGPIKGSNDGEYLDNEFEQEGFQNQTKYISDTRDDDSAIDYIDKVMDHHEVPKKERKSKQEELLELMED